MKTYLSTFLLMILGATISCAQGWERVYKKSHSQFICIGDYTADGQILLGGIDNDPSWTSMSHRFLKVNLDGDTTETVNVLAEIGRMDDAILTEDQGILGIGNIYAVEDTAFLFKLDSLYQEEWFLQVSVHEKIKAVQEATNGGFWTLGTSIEFTTGINEGTFHGFIKKIDVAGNLVFSKTLDSLTTSDGFLSASTMISTDDDGALLVFSKKEEEERSSLVIKIDAQGNKIWQEEYDLLSISDIIAMPNGDYLMGGLLNLFDRNNQYVPEAYAQRTNAQGEQLWGTIVPGIRIHSMSITLDGNFYLAGPLNNGYDFFLNKLSPFGDLIWSQNYKRGTGAFLESVLTAPDGGAYLTCNFGDEVGFMENNFALIKTDTNGISLSNEIFGTAYLDEQENCFYDTLEAGIPNVNVRLEGPNTQMFSNTDSLGAYSFTTQEGDFILKPFFHTPYLESCEAEYPVQFIANDFSTGQVDMPVQAAVYCPYMEVSIGTWALRPCFSSTYNVQYQNAGTLPANDAYIEIVFDSLLTVDSASIAYTELNGVYTFDLDTVAINESGSFWVNVFLDCDAELGLTHCTEAHIYPDSLCLPTPGWSGASIEVDGACTDGDITFSLQNVGTSPTTTAISYFVVEDNVILLQDTIGPLNSGEVRTLDPIDGLGASYYFSASQEPNHPGMNLPSVGVEGCTNENDSISLGMINLFAQNDANPFVDIDCIVSTASYDPNDKQGLPLGLGDEHFIEQNQALEYRLRFQNVGTDTAFNVVIIDTLSHLLDIPTIRPGASSHPYEFELSGQGIVKFTFPNILLPDSTTNELASQGFVKFKIQQEQDLPLGSVIENSAGIYFDFNDPVITNTTLHTIADLFPIRVGVSDLEEPENSLVIAPNPFSGSTVFSFEKFDFQEPLQLRIYDALGRLLRMEKINRNNYELDRRHLSQGIHFFQMTSGNDSVAAGKLIVN